MKEAEKTGQWHTAHIPDGNLKEKGKGYSWDHKQNQNELMDWLELLLQC